jgi:glycosyltransferase involved in cell wall biosynthesis
VRQAARAGLALTGMLPAVRSIYWWWRTARFVRTRDAATSESGVAVFFVYLDVFFLERTVPAAWVDRLFPWPWAGVVNSPAVLRGATGVFFGEERTLRAHGCRAVVVTDDSFVDPCRRSWPRKPVVPMPELADVTPPQTDDPDIAALRRFAGDRRVVVLAGVISEKKGVRTLFEVARRARVNGDRMVFVFAGAFSTDWCGPDEYAALAPFFADRPDNCWFCLKPLSDGAVFNAWIAAADVVWIAYQDVPYKSNVLTKAACFQKPVVVSNGGVMAEYTRQHRLGAVIPQRDADAALAALRELTTRPEVERDFAGFFRRNAAARLDETVRQVSEHLRS